LPNDEAGRCRGRGVQGFLPWLAKSSTACSPITRYPRLFLRKVLLRVLIIQPRLLSSRRSSTDSPFHSHPPIFGVSTCGCLGRSRLHLRTRFPPSCRRHASHICYRGSSLDSQASEHRRVRQRNGEQSPRHSWVRDSFSPHDLTLPLSTHNLFARFNLTAAELGDVYRYAM
jgi:hypothetical protein